MAVKMASSRIIFLGMALLLAAHASAQLSESFYNTKCPGGVQAVQNVVTSAVRSDRRNAAGLLRLHFHDCFVRGCDGSVLLASTPGTTAEKDAGPNKSLQGFAIIDQAKAALEKTCPGVFSCADILALAARDAISFIGGPKWKVPLGRRDGSVSLASEAVSNLPGDKFSYSQLISNFGSKGLSETDMVALSGAHTIGLTFCSKVTPRLYNFPGSSTGADPYLNTTFVTSERKVCPNTASARNNFLLMDRTRGGQTFDVNYYNNVLSHSAVFKSDDALISTSSGRSKVIKFASSQSTFFSSFASAMEKMGRVGVLTGTKGKIRTQCSRK
ncbi:hypothetical protein R1flu_007327 [Riccia fluitans]|uniref:Peroxidase n=1 Tax=Riccia fluitans TaxID=41844 RepID=A0ABD1YYR8_9MARC